MGEGREGRGGGLFSGDFVAEVAEHIVYVCRGRRTFHTCIAVDDLTKNTRVSQLTLTFKSYAYRRRKRSHDARVARRLPGPVQNNPLFYSSPFRAYADSTLFFPVGDTHTGSRCTRGHNARAPGTRGPGSNLTTTRLLRSTPGRSRPPALGG